MALPLLKSPDSIVQSLNVPPLLPRHRRHSTPLQILTIRARPKRDLKRVGIYDVIKCFLESSPFGEATITSVVEGRRVTVLCAALVAIKDDRGVGLCQGPAFGQRTRFQ